MFPSWYLLIPYGFFAFLGFAFLLFNVFHVGRFGLQSSKTTIVLLLYIFGFFAVSIGSAFILLAYDWSAPLPIDSLINSGVGSQSIIGL